jgi:hypothetical protein
VRKALEPTVMIEEARLSAGESLGGWMMRPAVRDCFLVALAAMTWVGVTAMAVACFIRVLPPRGPLLFERELIGFAAAFAAAGAISGSISVAIYGRWRRAAALCVTFMAILAISVVSIRWGVGRLTMPSVPGFNSAWGERFNREWGETQICLGFGAALGGLTGLITAGIVGIFAILTRRKTTWRIGLAVVVLLAGLGFWLLPELVTRLLVGMIEYAHWHHGWGYDDAIRGACLGAGLGGLAGPVLMFLVAGDSGRQQLPGRSG